MVINQVLVYSLFTPSKYTAYKAELHRNKHLNLTVRCSVSDNGSQPLAPEEKRKVERSIVVLPGLGNNFLDYAPFKEALEQRVNGSVHVAQVKRVDWLRNASGLRYGAYWRGTLTPQPTVNWYLNLVEEAVKLAKRDVQDDGPISILAHSAGGWLARVYMKAYGTTGINKLITLGSPHLPPPEDATGIVDQTRGILKFCKQEIPGAFHDEIEYTTIVGKYQKGAELGQVGTNAQKIVGFGYKQICGRADVWGDGIVPEPSAHLEGAYNLNIEGAYHSPVGASDKRPWYGSEVILDKWVQEITKKEIVGASV